jgi:hypothetical protein
MHPEELFMRARRELEQMALEKFSVVDQRDDEKAFGSRYVTLFRSPESFRLTWDGKEEFIVLEWAPDEEQAGLEMWEDVALWKYPRNEQTCERANEILRQLKAEFSICLQQSVG